MRRWRRTNVRFRRILDNTERDQGVARGRGRPPYFWRFKIVEEKYQSMKQFVSISLVLALGATPGVRAQNDSPITREGRYWVRTITGVATGLPMLRCRLDTIGNVVLQGDTSNQAAYKLKVRVQARNAREAAILLRQFEVKTRIQGDWMRLTVIPPKNLAEA